MSIYIKAYELYKSAGCKAKASLPKVVFEERLRAIAILYNVSFDDLKAQVVLDIIRGGASAKRLSDADCAGLVDDVKVKFPMVDIYTKLGGDNNDVPVVIRHVAANLQAELLTAYNDLADYIPSERKDMMTCLCSVLSKETIERMFSAEAYQESMARLASYNKEESVAPEIQAF